MLQNQRGNQAQASEHSYWNFSAIPQPWELLAGSPAGTALQPSVSRPQSAQTGKVNPYLVLQDQRGTQAQPDEHPTRNPSAIPQPWELLAESPAGTALQPGVSRPQIAQTGESIPCAPRQERDSSAAQRTSDTESFSNFATMGIAALISCWNCATT